jgi:hypothetical protein
MFHNVSECLGTFGDVSELSGPFSAVFGHSCVSESFRAFRPESECVGLFRNIWEHFETC